MSAAVIDLSAIQARLGGVVSRGGTRWQGPGPGHSRHDQSLVVDLTNDGAKPFLLCSYTADGYVECVRYLGLDAVFGLKDDGRPNPERERQRRERERLQAAETRRRAQFCADVWHATVDPVGTPVERYLASRGLGGAIPSVLRFHPACPLDYEAEHHAPAMVALVHGADGRTSGLHATALKPDGSGKAPGHNPRRMFGAIRGGAVRLSPLGPDLGIAEGVETARSFEALTGTPTWALLSRSIMVSWVPPARVERLTIASDGDVPGLRAAELLTESARRQCEVIHAPAPDSQDWNDVLRGTAQ
jgi:putative DNA primase/helicase